MLLAGKMFIEADIVVKTGMTIGGGRSAVEIGGIDNSVLKDSNGVPYIPGSSIKGKMRCLLEKAEGKLESTKGKPCSCGWCEICRIFGVGAGRDDSSKNHEEKSCSGPTRLYVRDAVLDPRTKEQMINNEGLFSNLELDYTETKWENTIDRITSGANPRNVERVPAGAVFNMDCVFNIFEKDDIELVNFLIEGMELLEDDYIGSNGSRGYGRIGFENIDIKLKTVDDYRNNREKRTILKRANSVSAIDLKSIKIKLEEALAF